MAKISVMVGATVQIGDRIGGRDFFKAQLEVNEIDTEIDVESQLKDASAALKTTFNYLFDKLNAEIEKRLEQSIK